MENHGKPTIVEAWATKRGKKTIGKPTIFKPGPSANQENQWKTNMFEAWATKKVRKLCENQHF